MIGVSGQKGHVGYGGKSVIDVLVKESNQHKRVS